VLLVYGSRVSGNRGVAAVISGYMGGSASDADYQRVASGNTAHLEAVEVQYHPDIIAYEALLTIYWSNIDPTDAGGQFADRGTQYRTAIFVQNAEERAAAEASKATLAKRFAPTPVATKILDASAFYPAEEYHQDYYKKNTLRYNMYKHGSGRVRTLEKIWGSEKENISAD
jgi:methionine-S-sulfoxide reductase